MALPLGVGHHHRKQAVELVAIAQLGQAVGAAELVEAFLLVEQLQLQGQGVVVLAVAAVEGQQQIAQIDCQG